MAITTYKIVPIDSANQLLARNKALEDKNFVNIKNVSDVAKAIVDDVYVAGKRTQGTYHFGGEAFQRFYEHYYYSKSHLTVSAKSLYEWPSAVTENEFALNLIDALNEERFKPFSPVKTQNDYVALRPSGFNTYRGLTHDGRVTNVFWLFDNWKRYSDVLIGTRANWVKGRKHRVTNTVVSVKTKDPESDHVKASGETSKVGKGETIEAIFNVSKTVPINTQELFGDAIKVAGEELSKKLKRTGAGEIMDIEFAYKPDSTAQTLYATMEVQGFIVGIYSNAKLKQKIKETFLREGIRPGEKVGGGMLNLEYKPDASFGPSEFSELPFAVKKPPEAYINMGIRYTRYKIEQAKENLYGGYFSG